MTKDKVLTRIYLSIVLCVGLRVLISDNMQYLLGCFLGALVIGALLEFTE